MKILHLLLLHSYYSNVAVTNTQITQSSTNTTANPVILLSQFFFFNCKPKPEKDENIKIAEAIKSKPLKTK